MYSLLCRPTATAGQLLTRILDEAALVAEVQRLPPRALAKLIDHVGRDTAAAFLHVMQHLHEICGVASVGSDHGLQIAMCGGLS